ncbi:ABC transporter substrate-binding protein [Insolitispirillum peregrinum]|uniref:Amino acid ABC transporter substrate-binding protein, PAAT family n=1 Tax=Insolitispirillum peregrinum TaxID=80876 RepID=A0A1N7Q3T0_9PROT|nr:ABC transporter substrate-binding protein [Insolitispirillum peregrinum]SIT17508.1 amino acid ABC transporter substrate-binding protein, PAAT family [Insolitispirillum peregrinum]
MGIALLFVQVFLAAVLLGASPVRADGEMPLALDIQRVKERGTLLVSMYQRDNPPFYSMDARGQMSGFDVEIVRSFARRLGVRPVFIRTGATFDAVVDMVARGEADIAISKISRTFPRAMRVAYTKPYLKLRQALLVNRLQLAQISNGGEPEQAIRNLNGRVGVLAGSSYEQFAHQKFPHAEIVGYPDWPSLVQAVTKGDVTAAFRDEVEIKKIIKAQPEILFMLRTVVLTDTVDPIAIAVNPDDTTLLTLLNLHLDDLAITLSVDQILDGRLPLMDGAF